MRALKSGRFAVAALIVLSMVAGLATPALAAPSSTPATSQASPQVATGAPVKADAGGPVDVQIWPAQENGMTAVLVAVQLPQTAKLPAVVRVPLMAGTTVQWAGEILGGDPNADPERAYVLRNGTGGTFAEFTLSKSRRAQVDSLGVPLSVRGSVTSVSGTWVQTVSSPLTAISVRIPAGAFRVKIKPAPTGTPSTNPSGESLYVLNPKTFKLGEKQDISVSYSSSPTDTSVGIDMTQLLIALGVALVIAVIAVLIVATRQRQRREALASGESEEAEESEADAGAEESSGPAAEPPGDAEQAEDAGERPDHEDEASDEPASDDDEDDTDLTWD